MLIGRTTRPGTITVDGHERLLGEQLHRVLAMLAVTGGQEARRLQRADREGVRLSGHSNPRALEEQEMLQRRIALLHMWLAQPSR